PRGTRSRRGSLLPLALEHEVHGAELDEAPLSRHRHLGQDGALRRDEAQEVAIQPLDLERGLGAIHADPEAPAARGGLDHPHPISVPPGEAQAHSSPGRRQRPGARNAPDPSRGILVDSPAAGPNAAAARAPSASKIETAASARSGAGAVASAAKPARNSRSIHSVSKVARSTSPARTSALRNGRFVTTPCTRAASRPATRRASAALRVSPPAISLARIGS